jgi:hypothetical protein
MTCENFSGLAELIKRDIYLMRLIAKGLNEEAGSHSQESNHSVWVQQLHTMALTFQNVQ